MRRRTIYLLAGAALAVAVGTGLAWSSTNDEPLTGEARDRAVAAALDHVGEGTVTETETGDDGATYSVEIELDDGSQVEVDLDEEFQVIGVESDDD